MLCRHSNHVHRYYRTTLTLVANSRLSYPQLGKLLASSQTTYKQHRPAAVVPSSPKIRKAIE